MRRYTLICLFLFAVAGLNSQTDSILLSGLEEAVEIITDKWGIPHIYAKNQGDLFFAQGYYAASDRLFQFEIWRRQATGTVAEILGKRELERDIGTRLFMFRKDIEQEMNHYHDDGSEIITAYVNGVNAYIDHILSNPDKLPIEFKLLNIKPQHWTPEVVISRHQGLLGNINQELDIARAIVLIGEEKVKEAMWFHPKEPDLRIDEMINKDHLFNDILALYNAYRKPVKFIPEDLYAFQETGILNDEYFVNDQSYNIPFDYNIGSNNWAISGALTENGYPILANDPHRTLAVPSLRYMAHLVAPGWNVIGGGEPEIPGISIGHNDYGSWGLTVFRSDAEDLYIYKTNPENTNQYWHKGQWRDFEIIKESIPVKNAEDVQVELKYSIHGPVCFEDPNEHIAYAVKCGWLEIGGSPYLASLRMDQAKSFEEFREACKYSHIPGENMVWADKAGNIGWQVVGINPIRTTHSGLVPVPGDGRYEWGAYINMLERPHSYNPKEQMIVTANENVTPKTYPHWNAVGYSWADPYRGNRIKSVLSSGKKHSLLDMKALQTDYLALPATQLIRLLREAENEDKEIQFAIDLLEKWDCMLNKESVEAGLYVAWETEMKNRMYQMMVPSKARKYISRIQVKTMIDKLMFPSKVYFGEDPIKGRDQFLIASLENTIKAMTNRFGENLANWQYGQAKYKHVRMKHPMGNAISDSLRTIFEPGPLPRGGYGLTVGSTGSSDNQPSGGTFRLVIDTGNWDHSLANNSPGQSGDPNSYFYDNLFEDWAKDKYFPLFFSRKKVEEVKEKTLFLIPR